MLLSQKIKKAVTAKKTQQMTPTFTFESLYVISISDVLVRSAPRMQSSSAPPTQANEGFGQQKTRFETHTTQNQLPFFRGEVTLRLVP
ncbi:hypothetical protein J6590_030875 [Homalodisca vitripennis]|nr:hypothetical protein J6590_030875 [Homalodisca vitripennis]